MNLPNKVDDLFQNVGYALTCPNVNPDTVCESCQVYAVQASSRIIQLLRDMPDGVTE